MSDTRSLPSWVRVPLAHRGLHGPGVPENTLAAFDAAAEAGWGVELDVRLSADGVPMVLHDADLSRTTDGLGRIADLDVSTLRRFRVGGPGADHRIPTLAEALDVLGGRVPVMVEIKNETARAGRVEAATADVLNGRPEDEPLCVGGFNPLTVAWFRANDPSRLRVLTGGSLDVIRAMKWLRQRLPRLFSARRLDPDLLSWNVEALDQPLLRDWLDRGRPAYTWTVRRLPQLEVATSAGVTPIFEGADVSTALRATT